MWNFILSMVALFSLSFAQAQNDTCKGNIIKNLAPMLICEGDSITIAKQLFTCANASVGVQSILVKANVNQPNMCDTTYKFVLQCVKINPILTPAKATLDCVNSSVTLRAGNSIFLPTSTVGVKSYLWNTGETTPSITVSKKGTYTVTITYQYTFTNTFGTATKTCSKVRSTSVTESISNPPAPSFSISNPNAGNIITYSIDSNNIWTNATYKWTVTKGTVVSVFTGTSIDVPWEKTQPLEVCSTVSLPCFGSIKTSYPNCLKVTSVLLSSNASKFEKNFILYPNPTTQFLTIQLPLSLQISQLEIFDIFGKNTKIEKIEAGQEMMKIDVSNCLSGTYLILFKNEKGQKVGVETFLKM